MIQIDSRLMRHKSRRPAKSKANGRRKLRWPSPSSPTRLSRRGMSLVPTVRGSDRPDLVLHVACEGDSSLDFRLWEGNRLRRFGPVRLRGDWMPHASALYRHMTDLTLRSDPAHEEQRRAGMLPDVSAFSTDRLPDGELLIPGRGVDRRVKAFGQHLWRQFIPRELKEYYAARRDAWQDASMIIVCDEPLVPWELVWPYWPGGWEDETPWCCTFRLTRWLGSSGFDDVSPPPTQLKMSRIAVIAPSNEELPAAQHEREHVRQLTARHGAQDVSPAAPAWDSVMDLLEAGGYDWFHVAAHGNFHAATPEMDAAIWLENGEALTPKDLVGPRIEGYIRQGRPAFVFNACDGGRLGWGPSGQAGWAVPLVGAGAGLFVGPQWHVTDKNALVFTKAFYQALLAGQTVGASARQARLAAREVGDPTWLAYSVYAHAEARVEFN